MTKQVLVALVVLALSASPAHATDFSGGSIAIPDSGSSTPYPSTVTVSGATRGVGKVTVRLALTHDLPEDIDAMLVGPHGQAVMLMSDIGAAPLASATSLRFDDDAAGPVPETIVTGTFRPTNEDGGDLDAFPAPAPPTAPGGALAAFKGSDPNGTWSLYVVDDEPGDTGAISSWTLSITDASKSVLTWAPAAYAIPEAAGSAAVTITRAGGALPGSVNYTTAPMSGFTTSAVAGADYVAQSGTLTFAAGQTTATLIVPILDDVQDGPDKPFRIHMSGATGDAGVSDPLDAVVTILDDDPPPTLSISDLRVPEHSDTGLGELVVSLTNPSERLITARWTIAPGTASADVDYIAYPGGFSIPAGQQSVRLVVRIRGDKLVERDETFTAALSDVTFATIARGVATVTIVDDDKPAPPELSSWHLSKRGTLELAVTSNFDGIAVARVRIGRNVLRSGQLRVLAGRPATVKVPLPSALRGALKRHHRLTARVAVTVSDGSVHVSARRTFRIHA